MILCVLIYPSYLTEFLCESAILDSVYIVKYFGFHICTINKKTPPYGGVKRLFEESSTIPCYND